MALVPAISPHGRHFLEPTADLKDSAGAALSEETARLLEEAFAKSSAHGLLALATRRGQSASWTAEFAFWKFRSL